MKKINMNLSELDWLQTEICIMLSRPIKGSMIRAVDTKEGKLLKKVNKKLYKRFNNKQLKLKQNVRERMIRSLTLEINKGIADNTILLNKDSSINDIVRDLILRCGNPNNYTPGREMFINYYSSLAFSDDEYNKFINDIKVKLNTKF